MAARISKMAGWRRTVTGAAASGALAAGLLIGTGVGAAHADVLDDINAEYDIGSSGGQVSNLVHTAMSLRAAGYVPSKGNIEDLTDAMNRRPNQTPLIEALSNTVAYMKRAQIRAANQAPAKQPPAVLGGGLQPGGGLGPIGVDPGSAGNISIPIAP